MKIDYKLSELSIKKVKKIDELRKAGKTWDQVCAEIGNHRTYLITLYNHYLKEVAKNA